MVSPDVVLNYMSVNSKYFNFDKLFTNTIGSITTKDIAGLNETSNIETVRQKFPYVKYTTSNSASAGNDYEVLMGTKSSSKTNTEESASTTDTTVPTTATDPNDKFPGVGGYYYQTVKGTSQFDFTFMFDGEVKTYETYDASYNPIYSLNTASHLSSVEVGFGDKSGNETFKKKLKEKLISAGWKTTDTDTDASMTFTNSANTNSITLNASKLSITFYNPSAFTTPYYETGD